MKKDNVIAILRWEADQVPRGLEQLEKITGNSTNPKSYPFSVIMREIKGANTETVILNPNKEIVERMIDVSKELIEEQGVRAIATSCGFNAVFQKELTEALKVPVFTSALLQVPFVQTIIGSNHSVCIVTANKQSLTGEHLRACGISEHSSFYIVGLEEIAEWNKIFNAQDQPMNMGILSKQIVSKVAEEVAMHPNTQAIVLECTDLPPFNRSIMQATGLAVFDFSTMVSHIAAALGIFTLY